MRIDEASRAGSESLGPVFTGWAHLLLRAARRRKLQRLYFVARDGYLLQQVTAALLKTLRRDGEVDLAYLHLSRRATQLAANPTIEQTGVAEAMAIRAGTPTVASLLAYHGVAAENFAPLLQKLGLAPDLPLKSMDHGYSLVRHEEIRDLLATESGRQRHALLAYLDARGVLRDENCALVDIGWRGSIQRNLDAMLASNAQHSPPGWLYLGLWREDGLIAALPTAGEGLLGDLRRGRSLAECAPWQAAFLLEAVCRRNEGTVLNFRMVDGQAMPVFAADASLARQAERDSNAAAEAVRARILDFVAASGADPRWQKLDDATLRQEVQSSLLRIAFLPTRAEIALGEVLVHTESHDPQWSTPLVHSATESLLTSPRQWLAGLASPWRGAYVMASGGRQLALAYRFGESLLLAMPASIRANLRRIALGIAQRHRPS